MTLLEECSQTFIVRIWSEPREIEGAPPEWRGMIEHVATGKRYYLKELDGIVPVIRPYLEQMGVKLPISWRVKEWLKRWKLFLSRQS